MSQGGCSGAGEASNGPWSWPMSTAGGGDLVTAALARELLVTCAAARECVADEHMFTVTHGGILVGTFRLQLFTAPGVRPVAIATQSTGEGDSLARR
jgi:hypothetical protein